MRDQVPSAFGRAPSDAEKLIAAAGSLFLLLVIGGVDATTGEHVLLDAFYLLPVLLSTWFIGRWAGFAYAALTTLTWVLVRAFGADFPQLPMGLVVWNASMRMVVDLTVAALLSRSRHEGFELRSALDGSRRLPEVIPICAWCRKLRDETDRWQTLEHFLSKETDVSLTHGVCAECAERLRRETQATIEALSTRPESR